MMSHSDHGPQEDTDQHLVPQMMIKKFVGGDGTLFELYKPTLKLGTRRRRPKGILFRSGYYKDRVSDFDSDLLKKVERNFARYYDLVASGPSDAIAGDGDAGAALIDWIASMLCRVSAFVNVTDAIESTLPVRTPEEMLIRLAGKLQPELIRNIRRTHHFEEYQDLLSRPAWGWSQVDYPTDACIVLTDTPVCWTRVEGPKPLVLIVPLSRRRVLLGGARPAVAQARRFPARWVNAFLAGWSERSVFAADRKALANVVEDLRGTGIINDPVWCEGARKPHLGLIERITADAGQQPPEDLSQVYVDLKSAYGPSILPADWKDREQRKQRS